jgi:hypothetical protein
MIFFSIFLILPAAIGPGFYSASNRNEYHKRFLGSRARPVLKAKTSPPFVSRLSRQCGILNISQPYRPPRTVTGRALLYLIIISIIIITALQPFVGLGYFFQFLNLIVCGLVVRVPGYRSRGPGSIPGSTRFSGAGSTQRREYN